MHHKQPLSPPLLAGQSAPNLALPDSNGEERTLASFWERSEQGLVLVFLRHFGCIFCGQHSIQLRNSHDEFVQRGYSLVAIGNGSVQRAETFVRDLELPFPVLADRSGDSYRVYGLGRGSAVDILNPKLLIGASRAFLSGARQGKASGDSGQLPGTFIVNPAGIVQYARPATIASDLAAPAELLNWIDATARVAVG